MHRRSPSTDDDDNSDDGGGGSDGGSNKQDRTTSTSKKKKTRNTQSGAWRCGVKCERGDIVFCFVCSLYIFFFRLVFWFLILV